MVYPPISPGANEFVAQGDVHKQVCLLRQADVEDFEIRAAVARTREHHLEGAGVTSVFTNGFQSPQHMVVSAVPIPCMIKQQFTWSANPNYVLYMVSPHILYSKRTHSLYLFV